MIQKSWNKFYLFISHSIYPQTTLGGLNDFHGKKNAARVAADLPPLTEDPHEVCKHMRAASPPASAADLIEQQQQPSRRMQLNRVSAGSADLFHPGFMNSWSKFCKNMGYSYMKNFDRSGHNFDHAKTAELSWFAKVWPSLQQKLE